MKKYLLFATLTFYISIATFAQVQRTCLVEQFTGENCVYCPAANAYLNPLIHTAGNFPQKIVKVNWSVPIPDGTGLGPKSEYIQDSAEIIQRMYYYFMPYGVPEAPYSRFNGIELQDHTGSYYNGAPYLLTQTIINDSATNNAPFTLSVTHTINPTGDSITINCIITAAQSYTAGYNSSLKLYVALEEAQMTYTIAPGSNGEKVFLDVMRKMMPTDLGTVLNNTWNNTDMQNITIKEKIPTYIFDKSQIAIAAWVQEDKRGFINVTDLGTLPNGQEAYDTAYSRRIHQAAYSAAYTLAIDAAIPTVTLTPVTSICNDTLNLTMTLQNNGAHTVTTCSVNYKLDANPVQTLTYNGSLATGQIYTVNFPTIITTPGPHTLICYSSNPNDSIDSQRENDTVRLNLNIALTAPLPIIEGFETTTSLPNAMWNVSHTSTTSGTDFTLTSAAAATGSKSCKLDNMNNMAGNNSILQTSSVYDMTTFTTPLLTFKAAYQQKATTNTDKLQVFTSTDCGATWVSRKTITSATLASLAGGTGTAAYVPNASQFTTYTVVINAVASSHNAMFRWEFIAGTASAGNNLYIDDINIVDNVAGIENIETTVDLNVYPNPSTGKVNIDFNLSESHNIAITVNDMLGRTVETITPKSYQSGETILAIGSDNTYQAGVYMVSITVDGQLISKKVIIQ